MLRLRMMVILASLFLVSVQGVGQNLISPEQAMEAVRAFESNPNLDFKVVKLETETDLPPEVPLPQPWWYVLEAKENGRMWNVNARTGEVTWAYYPDAKPGFQSEEPFGPLSKEECHQIAQNFARAKYTGFDEMNFELIYERWTGEGWMFEWGQKLAYGAWGLNRVHIEVNPINGQIQVYSATRFEQQPPRQPKITTEQATEIAKQTLGLVKVYGSETLLKALPDGSVRWEVSIGGEISSGDYKGGVVVIDAETGKVLYWVLESGEFFKGTKESDEKSKDYKRRQVVILGLGFTVLLGGITLLGLWFLRFSNARMKPKLPLQ